MDKEQIADLHQDREIALEIAVDMLSGALADCRHVLSSFDQYSLVSPEMISFRANSRAVVDRTSEKAMLRKHTNAG